MLTDEDKRWITEFITERLERVQTKLLTEFHRWASPVEMRVRSHAAAIRAVDLEIESMRDRIKLEGDGPRQPLPHGRGSKLGLPGCRATTQPEAAKLDFEW